MGVQHLWSILEQSKTEENIENLRDKTLCIDLSLWICEAQGTKGLKDQLKPYLRNVFFRTLYLASLGVRPVFVVDGVPPEIKRGTIVKRLEARGEHVGNNAQKQKRLNRSKFTMRCNECCEMLGLLGIPFIKSDGEAEAMCAWLNENNYADGVLTDDGDVFLYGAKVVYKDFNISSSKQPTNNLQVYRLDKIESGLGLTRRNMIALALLLGCDYLPAGVPGVGKETAVKLLTSLPGVDLLERFHAWKSFPDVDPHDVTSLEVAIKRKAIKVPDFPNKAVMKEFLSPKVGNAHVDIKWKRPDLERIKEFFLRKLDWPKEYTEEKMLILVTDWQLAHINLSRSPLFSPTRIVKPRVKQGKEYYEIEWNTKNEIAKLWPNTFNSVKPKEIICKQFPVLVEKFESELAAKKSKGKTKKANKNKPASNKPECFEDLLCKINCIDLSDDSKMKEHSKNDCDEYRPSKKTLQDDTVSAAKPHFEPHQDSENNADAMACYTRQSEGETSRKTKNSPNFDWIKPGEQKGIVVDEIHKEQILATSRCDILNESSIFLSLNSPNSCDVFKSVGTFNTPSENEKTSLNLADITVDKTFGNDLEAIDDLLTDSFVASLQNVTPIHGNTNCYNTELSPSPDIFSGSNTKDCNTLFQSNAILNIDVIPFEDESLTNNSEELSIKLPESLNTRVELNRGNNYCEKIKVKYSVPSPETPLSREATSLTSRLLKRFPTENRTNMINMLRSISGEEEHVISDNVVSKSTEPLMHHSKQNRTFSSEIQVKNEPLTNISNTGKEMKSSNIKPSDVVTVLD